MSKNQQKKQHKKQSQKMSQEEKERLQRGMKTLSHLVTAIIIISIAVSALVTLEYLGTFSSGVSDFVIEEGDGTKAIAKDLKSQGVINSELLFRATAKLKGQDDQWHSGTYNIEKGTSYQDLLNLFTKPQTGSIKVVIPEGKQVKQIAGIYEKAGLCTAADFMTACDTSSYDYDFLQAVTDRTDLEGYLFPDTYFFDPDTEPEVIINQMLANFGKRMYTQENINRAGELGYTFDEMVILASIIESEAAKEKDRYTISGVFHNRLNNPSLYPNLQSCVTVEYAMGIKKTILSLEDTKYDSPYNTYLYPGLPIGPICCPSEMSLQAALYPEENNFYYFQSDKYGNIHFAETFQQHSTIQQEVQSDWQPDDNFANE